MNDEQILRKLAETEGIQKGHKDFPALKDHYVVFINEGEWLEGYAIWNRLTNWADCGPLVEKYRPMIKDYGDFWAVTIDISGSLECHHSEEPDLKRGICLAIIKSRTVEKAA